jgi:hypothetical protein
MNNIKDKVVDLNPKIEKTKGKNQYESTRLNLPKNDLSFSEHTFE